jgi:peroxiredoxin
MAIPGPNDFPLPANLPPPVDDGAANHLAGQPMPHLALLSTSGNLVDLSRKCSQRTVLYCYPKTGVPGKPLPDGWDLIPGARGCTPQACSFRDLFHELSAGQTDVYGLSTQTTDYQREMAQRLHLPFEILSDSEFRLTDALRLPTFRVDALCFLPGGTARLTGRRTW